MKPLIWSWLFLTACCWGQPQAVRFRRVAEPKEGAFTLLAPADWRLSGGITRVNPLASGGSLNAVAAKLDLELASPDGRIRLRWYPENLYVDPRRNTAAAMFPVGGNYNGAQVFPLPGAFEYLDRGFAYHHPRASAVRSRSRHPLPDAARSYAAVTAAMRIPVEFRYDVGLRVIEYREDGALWEEAQYTAIQDFAGSGLWCNKDTFSIRTPAGGIESSGRIVSIVLRSIELDPKWVAGEIRGQIARNEISIRTQQEIARLDREITDHRRRTSAAINNQMQHTLMETEEYVNPLTRKVEIGSNAWRFRWVNNRGEAIYTDDPGYDPVRAGLSGYVRSPVRQR
jgi:hypothetical protein